MMLKVLTGKTTVCIWCSGTGKILEPPSTGIKYKCTEMRLKCNDKLPKTFLRERTIFVLIFMMYIPIFVDKITKIENKNFGSARYVKKLFEKLDYIL